MALSRRWNAPNSLTLHQEPWHWFQASASQVGGEPETQVHEVDPRQGVFKQDHYGSGNGT